MTTGAERLHVLTYRYGLVALDGNAADLSATLAQRADAQGLRVVVDDWGGPPWPDLPPWLVRTLTESAGAIPLSAAPGR